MNLNMIGGNTLLIKVYGYDDKKQIQGSLYDPYGNASYNYNNMTQLIMLIDAVLAGEERSFARKQDIFDAALKESRFAEVVHNEKPWLSDKKRLLATFKLQICFRRFDTWQGVITCMDTGNDSAFRSVLEMTLMLDSELEAVKSNLNWRSAACL